MKYPMQTAFIACILTAGSMAASGQAQAFGQQWRPAASGALPAHTRPYQRMTNLPSFRPQPDAVRVGRAGPDLRRGERYVAGGWRERREQAYHPSMPVRSGYRPATTLASVHHMPVPMPQPMALHRPQPSMADSFWAWQQMPTMAQRFGLPGFVPAWMPQPQQPAAYPYPPAGYGYQASVEMPASGQPVQPRLRAPTQWPETAENRRLSPPAGAAFGRGWRQPETTLSAVRSPQRPLASQRAAIWRGDTTPGFAAATPRSNRALGAAHAPPPQWRTGATAWARSQFPSNRFRPSSYGRSVPSDRLDAPRMASVPASQTAGLPGWATTYTDDPWNSCGWCSGS
jgi:hypothetical protein